MSDSPEVDFVTGLATLLDSVGIGRYTPGVPYATSDVGIVFGGYAQEPTEQIVLTSYIVQDAAPPASDSTVAVQVQLRGTSDPWSVKNRSGLIFNQLQGLAGRQFGDMFLSVMWRQSGRLDGKDSNNRWLSSENYYARVTWPGIYRTD